MMSLPTNYRPSSGHPLRRDAIDRRIRRNAQGWLGHTSGVAAVMGALLYPDCDGPVGCCFTYASRAEVGRAFTPPAGTETTITLATSLLPGRARRERWQRSLLGYDTFGAAALVDDDDREGCRTRADGVALNLARATDRPSLPWGERAADQTIGGTFADFLLHHTAAI